MNRMTRPGARRKIFSYILTVLLSLLFLFAAGKIAQVDFSTFHGRSEIRLEKAKITEVLDRTVEEYSMDGGQSQIRNTKILFYAEISGASGKERVEAVQNIDELIANDDKEVEEGDRVILALTEDSYGDPQWQFSSYSRTEGLLVLGIVFAVLLILFGRLKGVNTLVSLGFTCAAVFGVFVPSILSGHNIYLWTVIVSLFTIVMTFLVVNGPDFKTFTASLGCMAGVLAAGLLTFLMSGALHLTGLVDEESVYLAGLSPDRPIDLRAIVFAGIVIGALGAVMDTAMSVASALWEMQSGSCIRSKKELLRSGINIGRDMVATMSSTLILAYIGNSLATVLLLIVYQSSVLGLLNLEMIVVEILQALVGIIGILCTVPFTALICAFFFTEKRMGGARLSS